jgi:uncharacterized protein (TIGR02271 family)
VLVNGARDSLPVGERNIDLESATSIDRGRKRMATQHVNEWRGQELLDNDGDKIGTIEEIYLDTDTDRPEWALVKTGLFGGKGTFVPLQQANPTPAGVQVPFEKSHVKDAPNVDPDGQLSPSEEQTLYRHYDLDYGDSRSDRGAVGRDTSGPTTDDAMTRSEEELKVGTAQRETGRARLRKYVVTDEVQKTVPVQREEVRVEREPITDANIDNATDGPAISEEEHEVTLHAEEPVVEKRAIPKERVRLDKDTVEEERQVSETVAKEEIEVDGDRR